MEWECRTTGTAVIGAPRGCIDESSWQAFQDAILASVEDASTAGLPLRLDLADLNYMSSKGLRVLTIAKREADARGVALTLARPNDRIREILAISHYDRIIPVSDTLED
jgi:anti-sigma B factor antagonist